MVRRGEGRGVGARDVPASEDLLARLWQRIGIGGHCFIHVLHAFIIPFVKPGNIVGFVVNILELTDMMPFSPDATIKLHRLLSFALAFRVSRHLPLCMFHTPVHWPVCIRTLHKAYGVSCDGR